MSRHNTATRYGSIAKGFHWLTALGILTMIPLGIIAAQMAGMVETNPDQALITRTVFLFSLHKTMGVALFFIALARILWAVTQDHPGLLNGDKGLEAFAAVLVHWLLYGSLVAVPLSGWIHHAAATGFAPIWWPFGQDLPFVPKDAHLAELTGTLHFVLNIVLVGSVVLHVAGALKHHVIDGDATLRRMLPGDSEGRPTNKQPGHTAPFLAALIIWAVALGGANALGWFGAGDKAVAPAESAAQTQGGNWHVQDGTLEIAVVQMGAEVSGSFAEWAAVIDYAEAADAEGKHGAVTVDIQVPTLTLGGVTGQALGAGYLDAEAHPIAQYAGDIISGDNGLSLEGDLMIKGMSVPLSLPFTLEIDGGTARASGGGTVDRRAFEMGNDVTNEGDLAFDVQIRFDLTAVRADG